MSVSSAQSSPTFWNRLGNAFKSGAQKVAESYGFPDKKDEALVNIGSKVGSAVVSGVAASKTITYVGTKVAVRGGAKVVAKAALGGTGIGAAIAFAPDIYQFGKGFVQGWNATK